MSELYILSSSGTAANAHVQYFINIPPHSKVLLPNPIGAYNV